MNLDIMWEYSRSLIKVDIWWLYFFKSKAYKKESAKAMCSLIVYFEFVVLQWPSLRKFSPLSSLDSPELSPSTNIVHI